MEDVNWGCISWNKRLYFMEQEVVFYGTYFMAVFHGTRGRISLVKCLHLPASVVDAVVFTFYAVRIYFCPNTLLLLIFDMYRSLIPSYLI